MGDLLPQALAQAVLSRSDHPHGDETESGYTSVALAGWKSCSGRKERVGYTVASATMFVAALVCIQYAPVVFRVAH